VKALTGMGPTRQAAESHTVTCPDVLRAQHPDLAVRRDQIERQPGGTDELRVGARKGSLGRPIRTVGMPEPDELGVCRWANAEGDPILPRPALSLGEPERAGRRSEHGADEFHVPVAGFVKNVFF